VKLYILETCAFSFLFHLTRLSHSNAWPGTASCTIFILKLEAGTWLQKNLNHTAVGGGDDDDDIVIIIIIIIV
jgi:hypothetical protein